MEVPAHELFQRLSTSISKLHSGPPPENVLPSTNTLSAARSMLHSHLQSQGVGLEESIRHIQEDLAPAFNSSSRSPNYYGFVTGGATPVALLADNLVTAYDQNVQVHLPNETIATDVEDRALSLLCELLNFAPEQWPHRIFTTDVEISVGELGITEAMRKAGIDEIQILTTVPHSSLSKAASILGLGRTSVKCLGEPDAPHKFDMQLLKKSLERPGAASIVAISASEVNTGVFATSGLEEMQEMRKLCDMYGAWIHVDGAFGLFGRILTSPAYSSITQACEGLELADSITGDAHKLLNVPYDCGFFFSRHRNIAERVFQNPNAAYLASGNDANAIMSPLNIGLENSRRFRALPVYANLVAYGKEGYRAMLERQIELSRGIARYILETDGYELLPQHDTPQEDVVNSIYIIVLFRATDEALNNQLVNKIKATRKIYVSGTAWDGKPACRFAVSNWMTNAERDLPIIKQVLQAILSDKESVQSK
ncbi:uncharacterized protein J4E79_004456 [Alternaria viburni]|uniref:uncharacterized protein n=1 Tax=Alternaria viburni TaxID=566460 RepID=UPI0020C2F932|nr:uncharacterized protein J4E79_004456 [Alternaria viburni]KAI4662169.1 hypothetical protein J4E79_004456 [Alternaria viburni]